MSQTSLWTLGAGVLVLGVACGGNSNQADDASPDPADDAPAFAVATCVEGPDSSTGYVVLLDSLTAGSPPGLDNALEIPGCGVISGPNKGGVLFVGEGESPILRRYAVQGGKFREEGELSLAGLGITDAFYSQPHFVYLSATKAYILSGKGAPEVIVWNPQTMELVKRIPLDGLERGNGLYPAFSYAPQLFDGKLYVSARWRNDDGFLRENALIVIDTATDKVLASTTDERCGDFLYSVLADDGTIYFSNGNYASAFRLAVGENTAPPPCVLRVKKGATSFDTDFKVDLLSLTEGREGGGLVQGPDGGFFVQVFHDDVAPIPEGTEWGDVFGIAGWRWWSVSADFNSAESVDALPATAAAFDAFVVDGQTLSTLAAADYSETTFLDMGAAGGVPAQGRSVPGWVAGVLRVR